MCIPRARSRGTLNVHVIVTCSKRKRGRIQDRVRLSDVVAPCVPERAERWVSTLARATGPKVAARDLYQGEKWTQLRELEQQDIDGADLRFWILSAGYGLVPFDAPLLPYSATFGQDDSDSVIHKAFDVTPKEALAGWWRALSAWEGPTNEPRSIGDLVRKNPDCSLMIAASPVYLQAIEEDLASAEDAMAAPARLTIFSGGADSNGNASRLLAFDGRLRNRFGGSLMSLNVRVLSAVLHAAGDFTSSSAQRAIDKWMEDTPKPAQPQRERMSDAAVRRFVRAELVEAPELGWTTLLRKLRAGGRACEQKRFRSIHLEIHNEVQVERQSDFGKRK